MVAQLGAVLPESEMFPLPNGEFRDGETSWGISGSGDTLIVTLGIARFGKGTSSNAYMYNAASDIGLPTGAVLHARARARGNGNISGILIDDGWYNSINGTPAVINSGDTWTTVDFWFPASQGNTGPITNCRYPVVWIDSPNTWIELDWVRWSVEPNGALQLLTNNDFASSVTGWTKSTGSIFTWQTGGFARLLKGTSSDPYVLQLTTGGIQGGTITGRARVRGTGIIGCHLQDRQGNRQWGSYTSISSVDWTEVSFVSPQATAVYTRPEVIFAVDMAESSVLDVDWVTLTPTRTQGWLAPSDGDMLCDPASGRVMLYKQGQWRELGAMMAYQLTTARTLTLSGTVNGSGSTDFSSNLSIPTTVNDYDHYHQLGITWGYFSGSLGCVNNGQQIPWSGGQVAGPGVTGPAYSGNSIRFGKAGWWYYGVTAQMNDQTGAGKTVLEANGTHYGTLGVNHDSAGRWGGMAGGFVLSGGGDTITPYFNVGTVQQICSFAMFFGIWMRP